MRRLLAWLLDAVPMQRGPRSHDADEDFDESMCSVLERLRKDMQRAARMATVMRWIPPAFVERGRVRFEEERVWWRASERWDRSLAWAPMYVETCYSSSMVSCSIVPVLNRILYSCDSVPLDKQFEDGVELAAALLHRNQMAVSREALCQPALDAGTVTKEWLDARRLKQEREELSVVSPASPSLSQPPPRTTAAEMTPTLSLHDQFEQRHSELSVVESELDALRTAHTDASGIFDALSTRYAREVKITELMRDPEANMAMLQADVDEVDGRRQALKERWLEFRRPAEAELAELMHRMELMEVSIGGMPSCECLTDATVSMMQLPCHCHRASALNLRHLKQRTRDSLRASRGASSDSRSCRPTTLATPPRPL